VLRVALNVEQLLQPSPGGIGRYTARLASLLPALYPEDRLIAFAARHPRAQVAAVPGLAGVPVRILRLPRPALYDAWHLLRWPPVTTGEPVDVVHAPSLAVPPAGRAALVVTVHDAAPLLFPGAYPVRGRWFHHRGLAAAARWADRVITVSEAAADEIAAHTPIGRDRLTVVANGVDPVVVDADRRRRVLAALGLAGRPYILWVGSLEPRKGAGTLVAAAARLAPHALGDARLVLAGYPGWLGRGLVDAADREALGDRLVEAGLVGDDDLWALYSGATVFALPSRHEGFGLTALEAMSQGVAVVASDIPALREVTGGAATLVPPGDTARWAEAIGGLLADDAARSRLGERGRRRSAAFSWEATAAATHRVYEEVAGR
jgi:glycosyltransferase involved in cell wall biosynthesis